MKKTFNVASEVGYCLLKILHADELIALYSNSFKKI